MQLSQLALNYPASSIRKTMEYAEQFDNMLYFTMGEPNFNSPEVVKAEAIRQIQANRTFYGPNIGETPLRDAIADYYNTELNTHYTRDNVTITYGATHGILLTMMALLNPGDEVIVMTPHYPNYIGQIESCHAVPVLVPLKEEQAFHIDVNAVQNAITDKTKLILLNSPSNPLGAITPENTMRELATLAQQHDIALLSDEVYHTLRYNNTPYYSLAHQDHDNIKNTFVVDSFSKSYSMTGYRVGYVISNNTDAIHAMAEFNEGIAFAVPQFVQDAALVALREANQATQDMQAAYARRRTFMLEGLNAIEGMSCLAPEGAFYAFPNISAYGLSSEAFIMQLIKEEHVAIIPGSSFGEAGENHVRISFAASDDDLRELLIRLRRFCEKRLTYTHLKSKIAGTHALCTIDFNW